MGCDIHCYIEYKSGERWTGFGGRINPGRNYQLFGLLAGVRGGDAMFPPRGLPEDISYAASGDAYIYVSPDEGEGTSLTRAERYVSQGPSWWKDPKEKKWVSNPDWHTHSWLSVSELAQVLAHFPDAIEWQAMLAAMFSLEGSCQFLSSGPGYQSRLVFWFDN